MNESASQAEFYSLPPRSAMLNLYLLFVFSFEACFFLKNTSLDTINLLTLLPHSLSFYC